MSRVVAMNPTASVSHRLCGDDWCPWSAFHRPSFSTKTTVCANGTREDLALRGRRRRLALGRQESDVRRQDGDVLAIPPILDLADSQEVALHPLKRVLSRSHELAVLDDGTLVGIQHEAEQPIDIARRGRPFHVGGDRQHGLLDGLRRPALRGLRCGGPCEQGRHQQENHQSNNRSHSALRRLAPPRPFDAAAGGLHGTPLSFQRTIRYTASIVWRRSPAAATTAEAATN